MTNQHWYNSVDFIPQVQPVLEVGDSGKGVKRLHEQLNHHGYQLPLTDVFDSNTERAVISFQRRYGLVTDGRVGVKTQKALASTVLPVQTWRQGDGGKDVAQIQFYLNQTGAGLTVDGNYGPATTRAVKAFQVSQGFVSTGDVDSQTYHALTLLPPNLKLLTQADIEWASELLDVKVAAVMAVNEVESRGSGFFSNDKAAILYERHIMRRRLIHYNIDPVPHIQRVPNIVNTSTGGYSGGVAEYTRLERAKLIHVPSGLESASWGLFQIMGFHWQVLGYGSAEHFVSEMQKGERQQLEAFVRFIKNDTRLLNAMRELDWTTFARIFNGPAYSKNNYDVKMSNAFSKYTKTLLG